MRIRDLQPDEMSDAQRRVAEAAISGKRGRVPAPLRAWLHSPEMGDRAQSVRVSERAGESWIEREE